MTMTIGRKQVKIYVCGGSAVGKTRLIERIQDIYGMENCLEHDENYCTMSIVTGGDHIVVEVREVPSYVGWNPDREREVLLEDAGFPRDLKGVILVYDTTRCTSQSVVPMWHRCALEAGPTCFIVLGNKIDRQVIRGRMPHAADRLADREDIMHLKASAQTGYNVEDAFRYIVRLVLTRMEEDSEDDEDVASTWV